MAIGDLPSEVRVIDSLKQGWTNMWPAFWILLAFAVIVNVLPQVLSIPSYIVPENVGLQIGTSIVTFVVSIFVLGPLGVGVVAAHLSVSRGEKAEWDHLGYGFRRWGQAVILGLLAAVIVAFGFVLLIIPGIYLAVRLAFATYRFVHDDLDALDAIKASWEDTRGRWWRTFALGLMGFLLFIAGVLALGVGVFVAMVLVPQMTAVYFRSIDASTG